MQTDTLQKNAPVCNNSNSREWHELRHPKTGRFIGKYCPQTMQLLVVQRGERAVIDLPKS